MAFQRGGWTTCSAVVALFLLLTHVTVDLTSLSSRRGLSLRRCAASSSSTLPSVSSPRPTRRNILGKGVALGITAASLPIFDTSKAICGRNEFWEFNAAWDEKSYKVSSRGETDRLSSYRVVGSREKGNRSPLVVNVPYGRDQRELALLEAASLSSRRVVFYQPSPITGGDVSKQAEDLQALAQKLKLKRVHLMGDMQTLPPLTQAMVKMQQQQNDGSNAGVSGRVGVIIESAMGWGDSRDPPEIADGFPSKPDDDSAPLLPVLSVGFPAAQCDDDETVRERCERVLR
eukprot:jgi/Bigna1/90678/estExt_fgenesh1_pg.C_760073